MENLPTPLSRVELYLAKACGMGVTTPEPGPRLEHFLYAIAYNTTPPSAGYLTEEWLAYVQGVTPQKTLKIEGACLIGNEKVDVRYFAVAAGVPGATLPPKPQNRKEEYWAYIATHRPAPGILKYVTGKYFYLTDVVSGIEELQYVKGDTFQQTYSGKNLFNFRDTNGVGTVTTVSEDGFITQSKDNSSGTGSVFNNYFTHNLALDTSTTYTIVIEVQAVSGSGSLVPVGNHTTAQSTVQLEYSFSDLHAGDIIVGHFNTKSSFSGDLGLRGYTRYGAGESGSITYRISVLADTSVTPETFVYQPYTGGIPAPNPDYPQTIRVVTGTQTVTIGDGVISQSYPISLGSIELCKIGEYQDYIYKSGDDWYVHKDIGKVVLDGTVGGYNTTNKWFYANPTAYSQPAALSEGLCRSNTFTYYDRATFVGNKTIIGCSVDTSSSPALLIRDTAYSTAEDYKTWLASNNTTFYYVIATSTDTQITDATLISQLDALNSAALPKPVASITIGATGTNLEAILTIAYYGSDE